jgi:hypothetical protein
MLDWAYEREGDEPLPMPTKYVGIVHANNAPRKANIAERAKYIPIRFGYEERKFLRILEAGLNVCPYADPDPSLKSNVVLREKVLVLKPFAH